jgi:hypothetical protein
VTENEGVILRVFNGRVGRGEMERAESLVKEGEDLIFTSNNITNEYNCQQLFL